MFFVGVDPGASGGIAVINESRRVVLVTAMPPSDREILDVLKLGWLEVAGEQGRSMAHAYLERVWSSPGWGHVGAFRFGVSYGGLRMALIASLVAFDEVMPRDWQRAIGVSYPKKATNTQKKNITKRRAEQLFPTTRVTHAIADALLLAEYGRRSSVVQKLGRVIDGKGANDGEEESREEESRAKEKAGAQADRAEAKRVRPAREVGGSDVPGDGRAQRQATREARRRRRG